MFFIHLGLSNNKISSPESSGSTSFSQRTKLPFWALNLTFSDAPGNQTWQCEIPNKNGGVFPGKAPYNIRGIYAMAPWQ